MDKYSVGYYLNIIMENTMNKISLTKKNVIKFSCIIMFILIIISVIYIIKYCYDIYNAKKELSYLSDFWENENYTIPQEINDGTAKENEINDVIIKENNERILKLKELQKQNSDIIGWIEIENTDINYPVLQGNDNDFYMNHNYKKDYSTNGSIFLDKDYSWDPPSSNLLIYGHNMKNSTMFQTLLNYRNREFYEQHPIIRFTTNAEDSNYEIISVFESRVYYKSEKNVFRYYYFINANTEEEYNSFVQNAKNVSLYNIDKTAKFGDQLMTLSTCSYHVKDGRFAIVAKKISI